jgi:pyruvate dehydrogenase E1 component beta subunit
LRIGNPVIFIEHKKLYDMTGPVPEGDFTIPFGQGAVMRKGRDVTIVSWSAMVHAAMTAAEELGASGINAEVIDLRTLQPWDKDLVIRSVKKTGHLVVAHEACKTGGVGAEIVAFVVEALGSRGAARCVRVGACDVPIPFSEVMQRAVLPGVDDVVSAVGRCLASSGSGRRGGSR